MTAVNIFWDPSGDELDSLGNKKLLRVTDGDTVHISTSIRMLGIDTPEKNYYGKPSKYDADLDQLAGWMQSGQAPVDDGLAQYLHPKLAGGQAGTLQESHGNQASAMLTQLTQDRLSREERTKRKLYVKIAKPPFDRNMRLLAYVAPYYSPSERKLLTYDQRASFNYLMVQSGWAATFTIYPNIPAYEDLVMVRQAAREAIDQQRGAWGDSQMLTGYEFRMCVKLFQVTKKVINGKKLSKRERSGWTTRYCADMTTRKVYYPQDYYKVAPCDRIFMWSADVNEAVSAMNLLPE